VSRKIANREFGHEKFLNLWVFHLAVGAIFGIKVVTKATIPWGCFWISKCVDTIAAFLLNRKYFDVTAR
jgi:hypothetical protein